MFFPFSPQLFSQNIRSGIAGKQQFIVEQFTLAQGLSDNEVSAIIQDRKGFIWIGTKDGLNRFDGYTFKMFKHHPDDPGSISNNNINALLEDKDGRLWVATNGGLNLFDPRTETFRRFQHDPADPKSIAHNQLRAIFEDASGVLWLGAYNGLVRFNQADQSFSLFQHRATHVRHWETRPSQEVSALGAAPDGHLMVGYWGMGLMLFDRSSETFRQIELREVDDSMFLVTDRIESGKDGRVWIAASGILLQYSLEKGLVRYTDIPVRPPQAIKAFIPVKSGRYLAPSDHGMFILDHDFRVRHHFVPEAEQPASHLHNWATTAIEDQAGDLWFGAWGSGLFRISAQGNQFTNFHFRAGQPDGIQHHYVNALLEVQDDSIWVGSRRYGITAFNRHTNGFDPLPLPFRSPNGLNTNDISVLHKDSRGNIWIGTWGKGVKVYDPATRSFRYFRQNLNDSTTLDSDFITDIFETAEHEVWIGSVLGVSVLYTPEDVAAGRFTRLKPPEPNPSRRSAAASAGDAFNFCYVECIFQTGAGQIWLGTSTGLYRFDRPGRRFVPVDLHPNDAGSIGHVTIYDMLEDEAGQLWLGTTEGLSRFDPRSETFLHFSEKDGLPDGVVVGIERDHSGRIWLATKTGISKFDPARGTFKNYGAKDGLENHSFHPDAFFFSRGQGIMFAGGKNGLTLFCPDSIRPNPFVPPVYFSALKKYRVQDGVTEEIVVGGIAYLDALEFSHRDNILVFELTALNFRNSTKNQYAYLLEGFNDDWINLGTRREITFTNLSPGAYTLRVKAANNDGLWNEAGTALKIIIRPPWWATWWAYAVYFLLFVGLAYVVLSFLKKRWQLKNQLKSEQEEARRLKELDSFKSRLYTNLTHEFRTPLTVILGMVAQIRSEPGKNLDEGTRLIESNGQNLLRLINQLLDLSRLEDKSFRLHLQRGDIVPYLRYVIESFQTYANHKNLSLRFFTTLEALEMDYDPEQIKQVLTNLISNAVKFTPSGGEVAVRIRRNGPGQHGPESLEITVADTGIGIAPENLPHIFDRFYQVDGSHTRQGEGTGIGLAHTQELLKVMGGEIGVESVVGKGTTFRLTVPVTRNAAVTAEPMLDGQPFAAPAWRVPDPAGTRGETPKPDGIAQTILIIEDNPDVVLYLKACLRGQYRLDVAYNGQIGVEKALENIPDLIISDVMMPEMDGFEVCYELKNDARTSHIPIILLTAKADASSRITGLRRGADAYLTKPFDKEELLVRLEKLMERQKQMAAYFSGKLLREPAAVAVEPEAEDAIRVEDAFIQKVRQIVAENYADEHFALPQLCRKIGMSRSQLFRKMQALSNTAPSDFIRSYRLNEARILLETTSMNVSEVAWKVGFKDLSHFSKSYQEAFGMAPSATGK